MDLELTGKVAIVIGAVEGISAACTPAFAVERCRVIDADTGGQSSSCVSEEIVARGNVFMSLEMI